MRRALLDVAAAQCVYVGDDLRDVIAGNAAGMPTIVAEYGYLGEAGMRGRLARQRLDRPGRSTLLDWLAGSDGER